MNRINVFECKLFISKSEKDDTSEDFDEDEDYIFIDLNDYCSDLNTVLYVGFESKGKTRILNNNRSRRVYDC